VVCNHGGDIPILKIHNHIIDNNNKKKKKKRKKEKKKEKRGCCKVRIVEINSLLTLCCIYRYLKPIFPIQDFCLLTCINRK